jgi:nucleoside-diphosphate-sugar epimerase
VTQPVSFAVSDFEQGLIIPAIKGTQSILQAASQNTTVKRLVITSSFASVIDASKGACPGFTYTSAHWNPISYDHPVLPTEALIAYRKAKKFSEFEAWNYIKASAAENRNQTPTFDLVTFCPPIVFGPWVHPVSSLEDLPLSLAEFHYVVFGADPIPTAHSVAWVDVRDVALAHVEALFHPDAGGRRYLPVSPEKFTPQLAVDIIRKEFPEWALETVTKGDEGAPIPDFYDVDGEPTSRELGINYRSFKECIVDTAAQLRELIVRDNK